MATMCLECGTVIGKETRELATFCAAKCRAAFNNRRAVRGAEMYDLFMALRYQRKLAVALNVWTYLCRIAQFHQEDDQRLRGGRRSWNDPKTVLDRKPWLKAKVFQVR